jgi:hypothetical protein
LRSQGTRRRRLDRRWRSGTTARTTRRRCRHRLPRRVGRTPLRPPGFHFPSATGVASGPDDGLIVTYAASERHRADLSTRFSHQRDRAARRRRPR